MPIHQYRIRIKVLRHCCIDVGHKITTSFPSQQWISLEENEKDVPHGVDRATHKGWELFPLVVSFHLL